MSQHGVKTTYEVVGEKQVIAGVDTAEAAAGFRFGRMFPQLPPFRPTDASLTALGSRMAFVPAQGAPALPADDAKLPAGYTYFGQFIDHDITRDGTAGAVQDVAELEPDQILQIRSPRLDLDSLYGEFGGRDESFFDPQDPMLFKIGMTEPLPGFLGTGPNDPVADSHPNDLPRVLFGKDLGRPLIGDDRNDENLIVSQLHLVFLKFHNKVIGVLRQQGNASPRLFTQARELVTRHYQWLVLDDFVRRLSHGPVFEEIFGVKTLADLAAPVRLNPLFFRITGYETPPMPLEFSVATYRLGHSMIRARYSWNRFFQGNPSSPPPGTLGAASLEQLFAFTNTSGGLGKPDNVSAAPANEFVALPSNWIVDWRRLFDFAKVAGHVANPAGVPLNVAKKIDTRLAPPLAALPGGGSNLAVRNLIRGARLGLPCGQDIAALMYAAGGLGKDENGVEIVPLIPQDIVKVVTPQGDAVLLADNAAIREHEFDVKTPLWFYILREAELLGGEHLGPVGSRILIETFVGLIRASVTSIFNAEHEPAGSGFAPAGQLHVFSPKTDSPLRTPGGEPIITMAHLIDFVGGINPLGDNGAPSAPAVAEASARRQRDRERQC